MSPASSRPGIDRQRSRRRRALDARQRVGRGPATVRGGLLLDAAANLNDGAQPEVESDRGAVLVSRPVRLPGPLPELDVRLPPHPGLHGPCQVGQAVKPDVLVHVAEGRLEHRLQGSNLSIPAAPVEPRCLEPTRLRLDGEFFLAGEPYGSGRPGRRGHLTRDRSASARAGVPGRAPSSPSRTRPDRRGDPGRHQASRARRFVYAD